MVLNLEIVESRLGYALGKKSIGRWFWKRELFYVGKWNLEIEDYICLTNALNERLARRKFNRLARVKRRLTVNGFTWVFA